MTILQLGKNKNFLQRVMSKAIKEMMELDHLEFLSLEEALSNLLNAITSDLNHLVDIYERFKFESIAAIFSLDEKRLEKANEEFLHRLNQYIDGVGRAFNHRAVTYCNLGSSLKPRMSEESFKKEQIRKLDVFKSLIQQEDVFIAAIKRVNNFSYRLMVDAKKREITQLPKHAYQFKQLALFVNLDWAKALNLLSEKKKITHE